MTIKCKRLLSLCRDCFNQWDDCTPRRTNCLNPSANGVHTHTQGVIDFFFFPHCCVIATPSPPLTGTPGNPLVKLVLTLTTRRVTTLETFSC